jgi:DNA-binding response OmpR family regulator
MTSPKRYTVLLVEDNKILLDSMSFALEQLGDFNVITAPDGIEGLEKAVNRQPDCIVIDVRMPGLDGFQLVQALRGDLATASTPLIIMTALAQEKDQFTGLAIGADLYLTKPVAPQDLISAIHSIIDISEDERILRLQHLADLQQDPTIEED